LNKSPIIYTKRRFTTVSTTKTAEAKPTSVASLFQNKTNVEEEQDLPLDPTLELIEEEEQSVGEGEEGLEEEDFGVPVDDLKAYRNLPRASRAGDREKLNKPYPTNKKDPLVPIPSLHLSDQLHNVWTLPASSAFRYAPEGFCEDMKKDLLINFPNDTAPFLVRQPVIDITKSLHTGRKNLFLQDSEHSSFKILHGAESCGKSYVLAQTVLWARSNGWIVVWIPRAQEFMTSPFIEESKVEPGMYDLPTRGTEFAATLLQAHGEQFKQVKVKRSFKVSDWQANPQSTTIHDLLSYAATQPMKSCDALREFRREINLMTEYPVLIAVDGYNALYNNTIFGDPKDKNPVWLARLPAEKLTLVKQFRNIQNHGLANGTYIAATTTTTRRDGFLENFQSLIRKQPDCFVQIGKYSMAEFDPLHIYYDKVFGRGATTRQQRIYSYHLSNGVGKVARHQCSSM